MLDRNRYQLSFRMGFRHQTLQLSRAPASVTAERPAGAQQAQTRPTRLMRARVASRASAAAGPQARRNAAYGYVSTKNLCELEEISPRIGEESELAAYDGKIKRLSHDGHAATAQLVHCGVNTVNQKAEVVPAGKVEAVR